jgi:hypothetical protein
MKLGDYNLKVVLLKGAYTVEIITKIAYPVVALFSLNSNRFVGRF